MTDRNDMPLSATRPLTGWLVAALVILMAAAPGCDTESPSDPPRAAHVQPRGPEPKARDEAPGEPDEPPSPAATALRDAVRRAMRLATAAGDARYQLLDDGVRLQGAFGRVLKEAYERREGRLVFHPDGSPAPTIEPVLELLRDVPNEGLSTEPYRLGRIEALVAREAELLDRVPPLRDCGGGGPTQTELCRIVLSAQAIPTLDEAARHLRANGMADVDPSLFLFVDELVAALAHAETELTKVQVELDILLVRAFMQYVLDFRLVKLAHPDLGGDDPKEAPARHREELLVHLEEGAGDPAAWLRSLRPANPMYGWTVAALARYKALAAAGGIPSLKRQRLKPGHKGPEVRALKERLAMEGYDVGAIDERYDGALEAAVRQYQRLHMLTEDGLAGPSFYKSLNIPIARRVRSIELSLQRWRESEIPQGLPFYARVNIPQFEVEFWEDGRRVRVHRVIVGNNSLDRNLDAGVEGRLNHTRLFHADMSTVVLNPYWNVPLRIKQYELDRELEENPNYYEEHGFVFEESSDGRVYVKQGPGPTNALGRVKFLFPNEHSIYMHDTPRRHLFKRTYRAFSHGCIRLHEPIKLAKWLLERRSGVSPDRVRKLLATKRERALELSEKVPVYIEYNTVSVTEDGLVAFFDDVYRYDRAYWEGDLPFERSHRISSDRLTELRTAEESWRAELEAQLAEATTDPEDEDGGEEIDDEGADTPKPTTTIPGLGPGGKPKDDSAP